MKSVSIINPFFNKEIEEFERIGTVSIEKLPIQVGILQDEESYFDPKSKQFENYALIEKDAFSCNYRDKSIILSLSSMLAQKSGNAPDKLLFSYFGSEFVGKVVAIGSNVSELNIGDRVIPDGTYQNVTNPEFEKGIPSNTCSKQLEVIHQNKLAKIPTSMSDEVAAGFTVGAQTANAMVRKIDAKKGAKVLVTSATSNTSLFVISILALTGAEIYAIGSSKKHEEFLKNLGVNQLIVLDRSTPEVLDQQITALHRKLSFNAVIDPFADTWLFGMSKLLVESGKYVTCGFHDQYSSITRQRPTLPNHKILMAFYNNMIIKNLHFMGNCLGTQEDLQFAIDNHERFKVIIDSVFNIHESADFLNRTFNDTDRLGKVILKY